jgi:hypothetical protein
MTALRLLSSFVLASSVVAGCASAPSQGQPGRPNGNQLTRAELAAANSDNLYDAIAKLRPEWLTTRGPTSATNATPTGVDIYMNGTLLGKADYLRDVRLSDVTAVQYWDAGQASARFGMGHPRGVIELTRQ